MLAGQVTGDGVEITWRKYSGPGDVVFGNPQQPTTAATFSAAGHYTLLLRAANGVHTPAYDAVDVLVSAGGTPTLDGRLSNLSTRSLVGKDQQTQIAGFVIAGSAPKRVLLRAAGPALRDLGVKGALQDPVLRLLAGSEVVAENDDWSAALIPDFVAAGAAAWAPGSADAALVATLPPGNYSAQVTGADTQEGIGLVEVFELPVSGPASTLVNLSTRSLTRVGDSVQIAGFVISGSSRRVLIRASGPALSKLGIEDAVSDPELVVYHGAAEIARNDNWDAATIAAQAQAAGAFEWTTGSRDAAVVLTLAPGNYSAHVRAVDGDGGVALVEVYALP